MFVLGACASVAVQSSASKPAPDPAPRSTSEVASTSAAVIGLAEAPRAIAPNGAASITHLARGRNAYLGKLEMDPGGAVPVHRDPTEEFIHVLEGRGTMTIEGREYAIEPGTTVYMPAGVEVSYRNGDARLVAIQVFAGPEPAAKYDAWTAAPE
ncbi:cupin domain-containing protein [Nannocystaceae bacterium ST9]